MAMAIWLRRWLARYLKRPPEQSAAAKNLDIAPLRARVLLAIYNPGLPAAGGRRLAEALGWNDPALLAADYIADLAVASHGLCRYEIVARTEIDAFPTKADGFHYTPESYTAAWEQGRGFHQPDWADYDRIVADLHVAERVRAAEIDELWLFAFPYGGFYESRMAGPGAFWCNAPPLTSYEGAGRRFVIMGFNYERGVGEMLESFGHRVESIMAHVFAGRGGDTNLWERFGRYDRVAPGRAEVGTIHFAPNSRADYDWGNPAFVPSYCDNWYAFPDLSGPARQVNSREWGGGDIRAHHLWWLRHLPHAAGETAGISHNWWTYIVDPDRVA
jgi:hypothetical protein